MAHPIPLLPPTLWRSLEPPGRPWPPENEVDRQRFVEAARINRLLPFAANDPALDPLTRAAAEAAWEPDRAADEAQSAALDEEIAEVAALLDPGDYVLLRGAAYRSTIYPDPVLRPMSDIDMLVRPNRMGAVARRLRAAGYRRSKVPAGYFIKPPRKLLLEPLARMVQRRRYRIDYDEIFRERVILPSGAPVLSREHAVLSQALVVGLLLFDCHARKYLDFWLLTRDAEIVRRAIEIAPRWKMRRLVHAAMCLLAHRFPGSGCESLVEQSGILLTNSGRRLIERVIVPRNVHGRHSRLVSIARKIGMVDSAGMAAHFVASESVIQLRDRAKDLVREIGTASRRIIARRTRRHRVKVKGVTATFATDDPYSSAWFFPRYDRGRIHERPATELLVAAASRSSCFVDVGANIGWYTCLASNAMSAGSVVAFEMDRENFALLSRNLQINRCRNVESFQLAVSDCAGRVSYRTDVAHRSLYSLVQPAPEGGGGDLVQVDAVSLDEFFSGRPLLPDLIKIDVEGAEIHVLRGMSGLLRDRRPDLFLELHPGELVEGGSSVAEVLRILWNAGYRVSAITELRTQKDSRLALIEDPSHLILNTMVFATARTGSATAPKSAIA